MKKFKYVALNLQKKKFTGTFLAEDEDQLRAMLIRQNLFLVSAKSVSDTPPSAFFSVSGKISIGELTSFCRQLSIMINSGISILESLSILRGQNFSALLKKTLDMIYEDVKTGQLLSEAMKKHKRVFPEFFRSMIHVGEISGQLENALNKLADYYEKDAALKRKTKSALTYPLVLLFMLVAVVAVMTLFVIPTFRESMSSLEVELPALTLAIYGFSDFLLANGLYLLLGLLAVVLFVLGFGRTEKGRLVFDRLKLKFPLIRNVQLNLLTSRFANGFSLLVGSGLDTVDALEVICNVLGNRYMQKRFRLAIEDIRQGMSMTMAFEAYKLFPVILNQMIAIGEKSNTIAEVLGRSCSYFDEQVSAAVSSLTGVLQPIMLILMGGTIAVMFVAIYSPMLGIMNGLGG